MNLNITQETLPLLLPGKMVALAQFYAEDKRCSLLEALRQVYSSALYQRLSKENTKLWHLGATELYHSLSVVER